MICVINELKDLYAILEELKKFAQKYNLELDDPRLPKLYEMEQDAIRDENSRLDFAKREVMRNAAKGMKAKGYPLSDIVDITNLSLQEISAL